MPAKSHAVGKAALDDDVGDIDETVAAARDSFVACATWMQTLT
jgi:hypothetical protein